jgi:hypothetical protein
VRLTCGRCPPLGGGGPAGESAVPGLTRAWWHRRSVPPLIHFIPYFLTHAVALFLKQRCDRTLGLPRGHVLRRGRRARLPGELIRAGASSLISLRSMLENTLVGVIFFLKAWSAQRPNRIWPIMTRARAPRQVGSKALKDCKCSAGYYDADGSGEDDSVTVLGLPGAAPRPSRFPQ